MGARGHVPRASWAPSRPAYSAPTRLNRKSIPVLLLLLQNERDKEPLDEILNRTRVCASPLRLATWRRRFVCYKQRGYVATWLRALHTMADGWLHTLPKATEVERFARLKSSRESIHSSGHSRRGLASGREHPLWDFTKSHLSVQPPPHPYKLEIY